MEHPFALELRNIDKTFASKRQIFSRLSFSLRQGEYVAITGESGIGKSTLLNLIAGLDFPNEGEVLINGTLLPKDDNAATLLRRKHYGFIFQAFHILPHLTILQNVALPLLLNQCSIDRAQAMLMAVGLADREQDFPHQLSGGELQRVAIARALVHQPKLILADEPTGNLDPETARDILNLLRTEIKASGAAAILVTHSQFAAQTADRILQLTASGLSAVDHP